MSNDTRTVLVQQSRYAPTAKGPWSNPVTSWYHGGESPHPWKAPAEVSPRRPEPDHPWRYIQSRIVALSLPPDDPRCPDCKDQGFMPGTCEPCGNAVHDPDAPPAAATASPQPSEFLTAESLPLVRRLLEMEEMANARPWMPVDRTVMRKLLEEVESARRVAVPAETPQPDTELTRLVEELDRALSARPTSFIGDIFVRALTVRGCIAALRQAATVQSEFVQLSDSFIAEQNAHTEAKKRLDEAEALLRAVPLLRNDDAWPGWCALVDLFNAKTPPTPAVSQETEAPRQVAGIQSTHAGASSEAVDAPATAGGGVDTKPREPGCQCQWEEGDSPCPVHGEHEEALPVATKVCPSPGCSNGRQYDEQGYPSKCSTCGGFGVVPVEGERT